MRPSGFRAECDAKVQLCVAYFMHQRGTKMFHLHKYMRDMMFSLGWRYNEWKEESCCDVGEKGCRIVLDWLSEIHLCRLSVLSNSHECTHLILGCNHFSLKRNGCGEEKGIFDNYCTNRLRESNPIFSNEILHPFWDITGGSLPWSLEGGFMKSCL